MTARFGASVAVLGGLLAGCSLGEGTGIVHSDRLLAKECWGIDNTDAEYDLQPDFFAAVPYRNTLQIRVQRGNDLEEVSDGISVLVDDVARVRDEFVDPANPKPLCVALPPGVTPPGTPEGAQIEEPLDPAGEGGAASTAGAPGLVDCNAPLIHMSLYLHQSCHNQNVVLYAIRGTISFRALFSGDPNEKEASEKLTDAFFDVSVGDPRDVALGDPVSAIPEDKQSKLTGSFQFYFERGQPGQPFP